MTKTCIKCDRDKDISEFYSRDNGKYYTGACKECLSKKQKTYDKTRKVYPVEYYRDQRRKSKYNITKKEYDTLHKDQGGKCAICRTKEKDLKELLHIDHCHKTGKVRGLLCRACNHGLGNFKDNTSILEDAIYYLILNK